MICTTAVLALAALGAASPAVASDYKGEQLNQLETPRLTQAAQRVEFGVEGDFSAFRFDFSDPVRCLPACSPDWRHGALGAPSKLSCKRPEVWH